MEATKTEVITHDEEKSKTAYSVRNFFYLNPGAWIYNKNDYRALNWGWGGELGFEMHFLRIMALRFGFGISFNEFTKDDELVKKLNPDIHLSKDADNKYALALSYEVPIGIGINLPFNNNANSFGVLFGGYYRWNSLDTSIDEEKGTFTDYGLKVQTFLYIYKFSIGAEVRKSLNQRGIYFGGTIGFRFYWV